MNQLRPWLCFIFIVLCYAAKSQVTISFPMDRMVFQRNLSNVATVNIMGSYTTRCDQIQARMSPVLNGQGVDTGWQNIVNNPQRGIYQGQIIAQGGWYILEVRLLLGGSQVGYTIVSRVGVGEVVVIGGQSNAAGWRAGDFGLPSHNHVGSNDDRVNAVNALHGTDVSNDFNDPQLSFSHLQQDGFITPRGYGSWLWGRFGDLVAGSMNVPVMLFNTAWPTATAQNFKEGSDNQPTVRIFQAPQTYPLGQPYRNVRTTLNYYGNILGMRGIIWMHGENDNSPLNTPPAQYQSDIQYVIQQTRNHTGKPVSWMVARETYCNGGASSGLISAQNNIINNTANVFVGPNVDEIQVPRTDGTHLKNGFNGIDGLNVTANDLYLYYVNGFPVVTQPQSAANLPVISATCGYAPEGMILTLPGGYSSYQWSNGSASQSIVAQPGTYSARVTDAFGNVSILPNFNVSIQQANTSVSINGPTSICPGQAVTLTSNNSSNNFSVSWNNGSTPIPGANNMSLTINQPGEYRAVLVDHVSGCFSISEGVTINSSSGNVTASSNSPINRFSTIQLSASAGASSYQWTGPAGFSSSLQNPTIQNADLNNGGVYTLVAAISNGSGNCISTVTTLVNVSSIAWYQADLSLKMDVNSNQPAQNDVINYSYTVKNDGPAPASNVQVRAELPVGALSFDSSTDFTNSSGNIISKNINLSVGESVIVRLKARVTAAVGSNVVNRSEIFRSDQQDPNSTPGNGTINGENDEALSIITVQNPSPPPPPPTGSTSDIGLSKNISNQFPVVGTNIVYTITATNFGPDPATNVTISDPLPVGVEFVSSSDPRLSYNATNRTITVVAPSLLVNQGINVRFTAQINTAINTEVFNWIYLIGLGQTDPNANNNIGGINHAAQSVPLPPPPPPSGNNADIGITKSANTNSPQSGANFTYSLQVQNFGPDAATNVLVRDILPAGLEFVSSTDARISVSGNTINGTIPSILSGSSELLRFVVKANVPNGTITNTASIIGSGQTDGNSGNNSSSHTITLSPPSNYADLSLAVDANNRTPLVNDNFTYSILVQNSGPGTANNVQVKDVLPAGILFVSSNDFTASGSTLTATIASLTGGESKILRFVAKATQASTIINKAEISASSAPDPDSTPNNGTENTEDDRGQVDITASSTPPPPPPPTTTNADLKLSITANTTSPALNQEFSITSIVSNAGPTNASGVILKVLLPSGISYVSGPDAILVSGNTLTIIAGSVTNGGQNSYRFKVKGTSTGTSVVKSQVGASDQPDPTSAPDNGYDNGEDDAAQISINIAASGARMGEESSIEIAKQTIETDDLTVNIYPNPTKGIFVVEVSQPEDIPVSLQLFDNQGKVLNLVETSGKYSKVSFDIATMPSANYLLFIDNRQKQISKRIIKQ